MLESLRPVWDALGDVVLELQPLAWKHAYNTTQQQGLNTLRELMAHRRYRAVTLPRVANSEARNLRASVAAWNVCDVPAAAGAWSAKREGLGASVWLNADGLEQYINLTIKNVGKLGYFSEVLLTNRCESATRGHET